MSNGNDENQSKPSAALLALERYLIDIDSEIQKLENTEKSNGTINLIPQLEQELNSLWQRIIQFMENESSVHKEIANRSEQTIVVLEQKYSKFTDSYISYLDKTNETALSILKITIPVIPVVLAISVQPAWVNITALQWGFIILSAITLFVVVSIGVRRKNVIDAEKGKLLSEIDETKNASQKLNIKSAAKHQYANELLNRINISFDKLAKLK